MKIMTKNKDTEQKKPTNQMISDDKYCIICGCACACKDSQKCKEGEPCACGCKNR